MKVGGSFHFPPTVNASMYFYRSFHGVSWRQITAIEVSTNFHGNNITAMEASTNFHRSKFTSLEDVEA